jgi:hypothetical protein
LPAVPARPSSPETPIEVEVIEIDGQAPPPPGSTQQAQSALRSWDGEDGGGDGSASGSPFIWHLPDLTRRRIHPFWWPFILVAGAILLGLALTVGLAAFIVFLILRTIIRIIRAILA